MQFIVQKDILNNALNAVSKATSARGIQPVLSNVLIESSEEGIIRLCATDLDIAIEIKIPGDVKKSGSITLPAKKLSEIVAKLPEKQIIFNLNSENNITTITCDKSKFDIVGISSSEFPPVAKVESDETIELSIDKLAKAIKETSFAAASYDSNNILSGVYFEINGNILEMAATDGNRLARSVKQIENKINKDYSIVIPVRTLVEFSRILTGVKDEKVEVVAKNGQISFKLQDRCLVSRLIEGQYPRYKQLIPASNELTAVADRVSLISALELTSTMVNERTSIIKFTFNEDKLDLMADTPDLGDSSDQIDVEYKGNELKIAFNYRYVLDTLKVIDSGKVKIEMNGPLSPTLFKTEENDDYLCLIMPVQIK